MGLVTDSGTNAARRFHVQVGLAEYTLDCESEKEAVHIARQRLCKEMPHMRSVVDGILDRHFRVDAIG